ncbi:piggyBac transposable element-derived protein 4-like [Pempheris klunzingeri]|uniref:piggyBac transposable element-derived protein 4-like n=1 Tax=Pempheris klunzingeri TaxID=3127111 RepID=UPI00397F432A
MRRGYKLEEVLAPVLQSSEENGEDFESSEVSGESEGSGVEFLPGTEGSSSSEEEEEEDEEAKEDDTSPWRSKNGEILWSPTHEEVLPFFPPPILTPGPTHMAIARISSPETAFDLFFTEDILQLILHFTNLQGRRTSKHWKDVSKEELRAYLGLLILAGMFKSQHESTKSLWNRETGVGRAIFAASMSQKRFIQINLALRFDDQLSRPERHKRDKMAPIIDLWSKWSTRLPKLFNPGRDICVDEQLVPFKGRCSFRQYMPSKPGKYGLKIWALSDVQTSYAWRLQVYTGKSDTTTRREINQGMRVVLELTDELEGHTVTTDNFFTSFPLAEELQKRRMALLGTLRSNKPELPPQLLNIKHREVLSSVFGFSHNKTAVSYVPKKGKNVLLLSTRHREPEVQESGKKKPQIILDYNKCKGAVDHLDQVCGTYSCRRQTRRWPMSLFYHMLDVSCYNAYVLFTAVDPSWNSAKNYRRRLFLEQVGRALVTPAMAKRKHLPRGPFAASLVLQAQGQVHGQEEEEEEEEEEEPQPGPSRKRKQCALCTQRRREAGSRGRRLRCILHLLKSSRRRAGGWTVITDFVDWCGRNNLLVNASKTKEMVVDFHKKPSITAPVSIQGLGIERVRTYKYLGVHLNNKLDWTDNTDSLYKRGQSRLYLLRRLGSFGVSRPLLRTFFETVVASVVSYAVVCWGGGCSERDKNRLNRLIKRAGSVCGCPLDPIEVVAEILSSY